MKKDRAVFECDMAKKEKQKYVDMYNSTHHELTQLRLKNDENEAHCQELSQQVQRL